MKRAIVIFVILVFILAGCQNTLSPTEPEMMHPTIPITQPVPEPEPTETEPTEPEPTLAPAEQILESLTLEEKVGQLFLARCPDIHAVSDVETYHLGGYVLFDRDFEKRSPEQVQQTIADYQQAASIPMLIAVDEEGGGVTRVSCYSQFRSGRFLSPRYLYEQGGLELVLKTEKEKCELLKSLGINVNLAPVCDITTNSDSFMYGRSLGQSPEITGEFVSKTVELMQQHQVGSVLKHFPGYGNNTDTHIAAAVDNRPLSQLEGEDLIPFAGGIRAGCGGVMVSHTVVSCLDEENPASLSQEVHRYLREEMDFQGVIMTDDLVMAAISEGYSAGEAAVLAILAGNDLLCSSEYPVQYQAVLEAVQSGRISEKQLNRSVLRILQWKTDLGLL